jgi:hypothetical protein
LAAVLSVQLTTQDKGKVERPIRYLRDNFLYARTFLGDADLAEQTARWLARANQRRHGTTKELPQVHFERDEQHQLRPLAERPYQSLVLPPPRPLPLRPRAVLPDIAVEQRSLSTYAKLAGGHP